jgi:hypothetical protein
VHRHRKPARPFGEVTSHGLEWQFLKRPCLAGPLFFSLAVLDCSGFAIGYPFLAGCYFYCSTEGQKIKRHGKQLPGLLRNELSSRARLTTVLPV